jgi:hypothetical protein
MMRPKASRQEKAKGDHAVCAKNFAPNPDVKRTNRLEFIHNDHGQRNIELLDDMFTPNQEGAERIL